MSNEVIVMEHSTPKLPEKSIKEQKASYEKLLDNLGEASLATTKAFLAKRETAEAEEGLTDEVIVRLEKRIEAKT
jgi:hypothetical protein